jgi:hypothetical protein
MADHCTTRAFDGCSCDPGECQSASARLAEINLRIKTVEAKRRAGMALLTYSASLCIVLALFSLSFVFIAVPESKKLARANQENVYVQR